MLGGRIDKKRKKRMSFLVAAELSNFIFLNKDVIGAKMIGSVLPFTFQTHLESIKLFVL